jgi:hypothetical protein
MSAQPLEPTETPEPAPLYFLVIPGEGDQLREARWNKIINNLQRYGWTISGTGPDLDWPVRIELADESNYAGSYYEVYDVVPLEDELV